jgi:DNA-directed RNA polymerase subunit M/transcription elongation factor TFIIS
MPVCPKCEKEDFVQFLAKFITDEEMEIQLICQNCGNIFREILIFDGREIAAK